jgi:hypothetical protein
MVEMTGEAGGHLCPNRKLNSHHGGNTSLVQQGWRQTCQCCTACSHGAALARTQDHQLRRLVAKSLESTECGGQLTVVDGDTAAGFIFKEENSSPSFQIAVSDEMDNICAVTDGLGEGHEGGMWHIPDMQPPFFDQGVQGHIQGLYLILGPNRRQVGGFGPHDENLERPPGFQSPYLLGRR